MELFAERGFEGTTVSAIAERAGVTERTFFRHFADKREVLFSGADDARDVLLRTIAEAPPTQPLLEVITAAMQVIAEEAFSDHLEQARARQAIISSNAELREREMLKFAVVTTELAEAVRSRGVPEPAATLTAELGAILFRVSLHRWLEADNDRPLAELITDSLQHLRAVTSPA
ncbi:TetR family transcriptional regulator [Modestobacter versicolor]|nr:TetR family transcriptional regulator [Modestobacter versicolor]MBB3677147.1 AcrR family transcriptional regulator [Modestobacter versicolor]